MALSPRIPGPYSVTGPASLRPSGPGRITADTSGLSRGIQQLGAGISQGADAMAGIAREEKRKEIASDLAKAEAHWTVGALDIGNQFDADNDYQSFDKRAGSSTEKLRAEAAALIRDEEARSAWEIEAGTKAAVLRDAIGDRGRKLKQQEDRVSFSRALEDSAAMITEPGTPESVRNKARSDIQGAIEVGLDVGLIDHKTADELRRNVLEKAEEQLAINQAELDMLTDPVGVQGRLGVSSAMGGQDLASAAMAANGGVAVLEPGVAMMAAEALGDRAFPEDPDLAAAYLTDPEVNARYVGAAMDMLAKRYKDDLTAAVIAAAPDGGTELADKWVKSGHDENVLPPKVRKHYRDVMGRMTPETDMVTRPVMAEPGVDLAGVDVAVLDRYEKLQTAFGATLPVISGFRDHERNKEAGGATKSQHVQRRALDLDVSSLSEEERVRFIETASALGFTGIGVYKNTIHLDTGNRRAWGPSHGRESVPAWAEDVIAKHTGARITEITPAVRGVDKRYAALSFDQRLQLHKQAVSAADQQAMDMRAGIEVVAQNTPAAIMATGSYNGPTLTAEDYVQAYGAADGIARYQAYESSVDISEQAYSMRTMSSEDVLAMVQAAVPTSSGNMAAIETAEYETLTAAAKATLEAREKDPAGYTMQAFPSIAAAWEDMGDDPTQFQSALTMMAAGQEKLGIEQPKLLPGQVATSAAAMFNNLELSSEERMGALTSVVFATEDDAQQEAIMAQLVEAGVPAHAQGAMRALSRGDSAAASFLLRAAIVDPDKLPGKLEETDANINLRVQEMLFDENGLGDVIYGLTNGTAENMEAAAADATLLQRAVKLRLKDNSAGSLDEAIRMTAKDLWGDLRVVSGNSWADPAGVKMTLPKDEDDRPYRKGFNSLLPQVGKALAAYMTPALAGADMSTGEAQMLAADRDNYVDAVLEDGYFTNAGDGFVFIDSKTGSAVPGPEGGPLVFTLDEVLEAGMVAEEAMAARMDDAYGQSSLSNPFTPDLGPVE